MHSTLSVQPITVPEACNALLRLKQKGTRGLDDLQVTIIKHSAPVITKTHLHLQPFVLIRILFLEHSNNFLYLLLKAYSPVNRTGSPQGFSQIQILHMSQKTN